MNNRKLRLLLRHGLQLLLGNGVKNHILCNACVKIVFRVKKEGNHANNRTRAKGNDSLLLASCTYRIPLNLARLDQIEQISRIAFLPQSVSSRIILTTDESTCFASKVNNP